MRDELLHHRGAGDSVGGRRTRAAFSTVIVVALATISCAGGDALLERSWRERGPEAPPLSPRDGAVSPASPARVAVAPTDTLSSTEQLLALAWERSPRLAVAWQEWRGALAEVPKAGTWPDPTVGYSYMARMGDEGRPHRFSFSQMIPLGKLGPASEAARWEAQAMGAEHAAVWWGLRAAILADWYEIYRLDRELEFLRRHDELLESWQAVAETRYAAGSLDYAEVLRIEIERSALRDRTEGTEEQSRAMAAKVNAMLDRAPDAPVRPSRELPELPPMTEDTALPALTQNLDRNPEVAVRRHRVERSASERRVAQRSAWPDLMVGVEYPGMATRMPDSDDTPIMFMVGASIPIWWSRQGALREGALAMELAAKEEERSARRDAEAELRAAYFRYRDADRRARFYRDDQLPRIEQSIAVLEERFISGSASLLELLDLERTALEAELLRIEALAERASIWAELEALTGGNLSEGMEDR